MKFANVCAVAGGAACSGFGPLGGAICGGAGYAAGKVVCKIVKESRWVTICDKWEFHGVW